MIRWTRRLTLLTFGTLSLALVLPPAASASCAPLDALCAADEGSGVFGDALNPIGPVDDPVEDLTDPVLDPIDPVLDDTVDEVTRLLEDPPVEPPVGGGGGGHHGGGGPGPGDGQGPGAGGGTLAPRGRDGIGRGLGSFTLGSPSAGALDPVGRIAPPQKTPSVGDRFGRALGGAARSLAFVLGLLSVVAGFVLIQDRLDRKDPRLALAPVGSDTVSFA